MVRARGVPPRHIGRARRRLIWPECTVRHTGMLPTEFEHFAERFGAEADLEAGKGNAAFAPTTGALRCSRPLC